MARLMDAKGGSRPKGEEAAEKKSGSGRPQKGVQPAGLKAYAAAKKAAAAKAR